MKIQNIKQLFLISSFIISALNAHAQDSSMIVDQNFKNLFNTYRFAQPSHVPWAGSFFAFRYNGTAVGSPYSPMDKYDQAFNGGKNLAANFEMQEHSCDHLSGGQKSSCESWWGHCNGWSAAAIKEIEPRKTITVNGVQLGVGDQKGILSEVWLSANTFFMGSTNKSRVASGWILDPNDPDYRSYWDVTPRQLFLTFTNQIGMMGTGVVIDRHTGDEVWNQPVVGYRILPLSQSDLGVQTYQGKQYHYARFTIKMYWADDHVAADHISDTFDIKRTSDERYPDSLSDEYKQRTLSFKLFFDRALQITNGGKSVANDVTIIGDGLWQAQEEGSLANISQSHPDFIWSPISPLITNNGIANPYLSWENSKKMTTVANGGRLPPDTQQPPIVPVPNDPIVQPPQNTQSQFVITVDRKNIYDGDSPLIAERLIARIFRRANLEVDVDQSRIRFVGSQQIEFIILGVSDLTPQLIKNALEDASATVISIN